jgi:hypothetical protein
MKARTTDAFQRWIIKHVVNRYYSGNLWEDTFMSAMTYAYRSGYRAGLRRRK